MTSNIQLDTALNGITRNTTTVPHHPSPITLTTHSQPTDPHTTRSEPKHHPGDNYPYIRSICLITAIVIVCELTHNCHDQTHATNFSEHGEKDDRKEQPRNLAFGFTIVWKPRILLTTKVDKEIRWTQSNSPGHFDIVYNKRAPFSWGSCSFGWEYALNFLVSRWQTQLLKSTSVQSNLDMFMRQCITNYHLVDLWWTDVLSGTSLRDLPR